MPIIFVISLVQASAALYVIIAGLLALNAMGPHTSHLSRLAYIALVTGAVAEVWSCFGARDVSQCLFAVGVALFLAGNRRRVERRGLA